MFSSNSSLETVIVGPRGSCKTLLMTHFECEAMAQAWVIKLLRKAAGNNNLHPRRKVNVWSNFPVKALWKPPIPGKAVLLQSQELDLEKLIVWDPMFENGYIFFDEIDQVADKQDWMATLPKMLAAGIQIMRHRNLSLVLSIQSLSWLNSRIQWQADIVIKCMDKSYTPYGRDRHFQPGEVAETTWIDKSGLQTGHPYEESYQTYPMQFFGKRYWNNYETYHAFNVLDLKTKYKIKSKVRQIDLSGDAETREINEAVIEKTIEYFAFNNPGEDIKSTVFWAIADECGLDIDHIAGGKIMTDIGVPQRSSMGYVYYKCTDFYASKAGA